MKSLSKSQEPNKGTLTEFEGVARLSDADHLTINEVGRATMAGSAQEWQKIKDLLEQKATSAIEPYVLAILEENKASPGLQRQTLEQTRSILEKIASPMSAQTTCYFRAGKAYLRISHEMGDIGNLFFKSLFCNILKDFGGHYHIQTQENTICAICRI
ncbi:MAG: hypothetical protein EPO62_00625 [Candidatus Nitrosotenuis sp.]|nr:MAG: hypothetical protein EPO62_00625 [Candidatus Nitrosotenuis sp.]